MQHKILDVIGSFYDGAADPAQWSIVLERAAALVGGTGAAISIRDLASNETSIEAHWNIAPELEASLHEHTGIDPITPLLGLNEVDRPFSAFRALGECDLKQSLWYKLAAEPNDVGDMAVVLVDKADKKFASLSFYREDRCEPYDSRELSILRIISPHIRRAAMIAGILDERKREHDKLASVLELLMDGIVLTDGAGRIVHTNASAFRCLQRATSLRQEGDRLVARDFNIRAAIVAAGREAYGSSSASRSFILKGECGRDLAVWIMPLGNDRRRYLTPISSARIAVFVREIGATELPFPAELFIRYFGITLAESRVLHLLLQGMSLERAAELLGISSATARTHLARLFTKTGTQRQADLMRLAISAASPALP